jgi:hypothetical protein
MNCKWLVGVVLGMGLGFAAATVGWHARADGQAVQVQGAGLQHWEYKVIWLQPQQRGGSVKAVTADFNALAQDGWEYVGPVVHTGYGQTPATDGLVYVVFKRAK